MSRQVKRVAVVIGVMVAATAGANAQTPALTQAQIQAQMQELRTQIQVHVHERIVNTQELMDQIHQLIETSLGASLSQQLSRDLGRSAGEIARAMEGLHAVPAIVEQGRDYQFKQESRETKTLAIGASGTLTLKNIAGDIIVKAGGSRDATVEVVRLSKGKTEADAKAGLEKVTAEVDVRGEHGSVTAKYPADVHPDYSVSVSYNVTAPAGTSVWVDSISGQISLTGLQGDTKASTVSGKMDVTSCTKVGSLRTFSGTITVTDSRSDTKLDVGGISATVTMKNVKAPQVSTSVISGKIVAHDITTDGADFGSMSGDIEFTGAVSPKGRYEFTAHSGDVRLGLTGGFDLELKTFSGTVTADASLNLTSSTPASSSGAKQRTVRGSTGSGGGSVVASTFSGTVWVGRKLQ